MAILGAKAEGREPRADAGRIFFLAFLIATCAGAGGVLNAPAQIQPPSEYQVKAVFLYNFAKFVEWPPEAFADASAPVILGIIGDDPFGAVLDRTIKGKTVNGRALLVKRAKQVRDLKGCHIVFISASERERLAQILEALSRSSVLTIGETERFVHLGGIINFIIEANKVHFEINVDVARRAQLKISSKLLTLAKLIRDDRHAGGK
jgi:hypothetical protein